MISQWPTEQVLPMQLGYHVLPMLVLYQMFRYIFGWHLRFESLVAFKVNKHNKHGLNLASRPQNSNPERSLQRVAPLHV